MSVLHDMKNLLATKLWAFFRRVYTMRTPLIVIGVLVVLFFWWYHHSAPHFSPGSIYSIKYIQRPPPSVGTGVYEVRDEDVIRQYVEAFNTLELKPITALRFHPRNAELLSNAYIGSRHKVQRTWGFAYNISYLPRFEGKRALLVNGRYFSIESGSYSTLMDILSDQGTMIPLSQY